MLLHIITKQLKIGLIKHYEAIAKETSLPIILYNVPSRTGLNILPKTCFELSKIDNIVAIKEASGNISQVAEIANICKDDLHIYSGNDDQILPVLSLGGLGVISVLSNIAPKKASLIIKDSISMQLEALPLIQALFCEVNPIPVKMALNLMGYNLGSPRLPLIDLSSSKIDLLKSEMTKYGIL